MATAIATHSNRMYRYWIEICMEDSHCNTHHNTHCNTHCSTHCNTHYNIKSWGRLHSAHKLHVSALKGDSRVQIIDSYCSTHSNKGCKKGCNTHCIFTATHTTTHTVTHTATHTNCICQYLIAIYAWCVRCLLITESPKTSHHYRYQI